MKKLLAVFLSVLMLCAMLPLSAVSVSAATSGTTGDCTWMLDGTHLTISGNGAMGDYASSNKAPWGTAITSVTIEEGVTSLGDWAFYGCKSLQSVTIPDSVTSIGNSAFRACTSLESATIPDRVTSIGSNAFDGCTSLQSVTIPDSVTEIGKRAFLGCTSLQSVTIGDSVTSIGDYAFDSCTSLQSVYITDVAAWCGISFRNSFANPLTYGENLCVNGVLVTNLVIPDSVSSIGQYAFYTCTSLQSVTIPNSVTSIGSYAFRGCSSLESVTIPDSITSIGKYTFYGCTSLQSVTIPDSVTWIGHYAFYECTSLQSVAVPNSVTSIGDDAFYKCTSLLSVTIPDSVTSIGDAAFRRCTSLTSVTIPDSVTKIGWYAFEGCTSLQSVTIPDSVTEIGNYAFRDCTSLESVTTPDSVTKIGISAFEGCSELTDVYYEGNETDRAAITIDMYNDPLLDATWHYVCHHEYEYACDTNCKICGETTNEEAVHSLIHVPAVEGNCITLGHGEYWYCEYCGACWGDNLLPPSPPRYGDHKYDAVATAPTCTWTGYTTYTCSVCGDTYTETIPALGHTYDNACDATCNVCGDVRSNAHVFDNVCDADCNECGATRIPRHVYNYACDTECNLCGTKRTTFGDAVTIDFTDIANRTFYSTSQQVWEQNGIVVTGYKGASTSNVGDRANPARFYKSSTVTIEYPGMTAIVIDSVIYTDNDYAIGWADSVSADATAIVDGNVVTIVLDAPVDVFVWEKLVSQCRAYSITIYTASIADHVYDNACDADCNVCGATREVDGHAYVGTVITPADCYDDGETTYTCSVCGDTYTETIPALGHDLYYYSEDVCWQHHYSATLCTRCDYVTDWWYTPCMEHHGLIELGSKAPTCTEDGYEYAYTCTVCGETGCEPIPALGHTYDNACDVDCNVCGEIREEINHNYVSKVTTPATCVDVGVMTNTCTVCGDSYTDVLPPTGKHTYSNACDYDCNVCGATRVAPHAYSNVCDRDCNLCGTTRTAPHMYDGDCDNTCNRCGIQRKTTADHVYSDDCDAYCDVCTAIREEVNHVYSDPCDYDCNHCAALREPPHNYADKYDEECDTCGAWREIVIIYGDANGDSFITVIDEAMLSQYLAGWDVPLDEVATDVNNDGEISIIDEALLSQYLAGWNVTFG